jgi:hypothetical protein
MGKPFDKKAVVEAQKALEAEVAEIAARREAKMKAAMTPAEMVAIAKATGRLEQLRALIAAEPVRAHMDA